MVLWILKSNYYIIFKVGLLTYYGHNNNKQSGTAFNLPTQMLGLFGLQWPLWDKQKPNLQNTNKSYLICHHLDFPSGNKQHARPQSATFSFNIRQFIVVQH